MIVVNENIGISPLPFYCSSFEPETIKETLQGTVFTENEILLDDEGLAKYKRKLGIRFCDPDVFDEGRFVGLFKRPESYVCKTDAFGQETLFYYSDGKHWAISSSLMFLVEKLRENNVGLDIYEPALQSFMVGNQSLFGGQLLSFRTGVKQIRLLPHNKQIEISMPLNKGRFNIHKRSFAPIAINNERDYILCLSEYITSWHSRLKKLADINFIDKAMGLSGGYDTRVNLAIFLSLNNEDLMQKISIITDERKPQDFAAVELLAKTLGLSISTVSKLPGYSKHNTTEQEMALWRYGAAGIYLPVYRMRSASHTDVLKLHGANYRGRAYITKPATERAELYFNKLPGPVAYSVKEEFLNSFDELDISVDNYKAIQEHYLAFRCRLHYGRNWHWRFRNLFVTPQLSCKLKALTDWKILNQETPEQVTCDILYSSNDRRLASLPFDTPEKSFSDKSISKAKKLGLDLSKINSKKIDFYGKISHRKDNKVANTGANFYDMFMEKFEDARKNKKVLEIYGKSFLQEAGQQKSYTSLLKTGKISAVVAAQEILKAIK